MTNSGNTSRATRRRQPSTTTAALEYDGLDTPVLIRLPDLAAAQAEASQPRQSSPRHPAPQDLPDSNDDHVQKRQRRRRRFDRSHALAKQERRKADAHWFEQMPRSRIAIGALVLAAIGITYYLIPSGGPAENESSQIADPWSAELPNDGLANDVQVVMPANLWPPSEQTGGPQGALPLNPPEGFGPQQAAAHALPSAWSESGIFLASPAGNSPPMQSQHVDQVMSAGGEVPNGVPARPVSSQSNWPDASPGAHQTTIPASPINQPTQPRSLGAPTRSNYSPPPVYPQNRSYGAGSPQSPWSGAAADANQAPRARLSGPELDRGTGRFVR